MPESKEHRCEGMPGDEIVIFNGGDWLLGLDCGAAASWYGEPIKNCPFCGEELK